MKITENTIICRKQNKDTINTNEPTEGILERILSRDNMNEVFLKVKRNKGAGGVDKMEIDELLEHLKTHREEILTSETSYGFRSNRGCHDALKKCQEYANQGYWYVIDMDLEKFFDTVNQPMLMGILSRTIKDNRVLSLIQKFLNAGIMDRGMFVKSEVGVPQGGPISPLLANVMLNELDKSLDKAPNEQPASYSGSPTIPLYFP